MQQTPLMILFGLVLAAVWFPPLALLVPVYALFGWRGAPLTPTLTLHRSDFTPQAADRWLRWDLRPRGLPGLLRRDTLRLQADGQAVRLLRYRRGHIQRTITLPWADVRMLRHQVQRPARALYLALAAGTYPALSVLLYLTDEEAYVRVLSRARLAGSPGAVPYSALRDVAQDWLLLMVPVCAALTLLLLIVYLIARRHLLVIATGGAVGADEDAVRLAFVPGRRVVDRETLSSVVQRLEARLLAAHTAGQGGSAP